jgi:hypothetical protein
MESFEKPALDKTLYVCSVPCKRRRSHVGETGRLIAGRLRHSKHNLRGSLLEPEEGQKIGWNEARISVMGGNSKYGKCKESAHTILANSITQPNLEASLGKEFGNS